MSDSRISSRLLLLAAGAFAVGTEGFMVAGILPAIARDLGVSVTSAGHLVTIFALAYAIGSPLLSALLGGVDRKRLLAGALAVLVVSNILAATATSFTMLVLARVLMGLGAGLYMPAANAVAVSISPPEMRARALSVVTGGLTVAVALGVPIGIFVAGLSDWRLPFLLVAGACLIALAGLWLGLPRDLPRGAATLTQRIAVARRPDVLIALGTTLMWTAGAFTIYTYLAPLLERTAGIAGTTFSVLLFVFGIGSAIGNAVGGVASDRFGPVPTLVTVLSALTLSFLAFSALSLVPATLVVPFVAIVMALWGVFGWGGHPAQSSRLVSLAPDVAIVALSLNASALYFGFATGAALGSLTLSVGAYEHLGLVGALCEVLSVALIGLSLWRRRAAETAEARGTA